MYKLKSTIGRSYLVNPDDILPTKKNLQSLGYYSEPSYGMTEYPDEDMIQGIERFQKDNGLMIDGVMKPEGETETKLNQIVETKNRSRQKTPYTNCYPGVIEQPQSLKDKFAQDFGKNRILQRRNILTFAMNGQTQSQNKSLTPASPTPAKAATPAENASQRLAPTDMKIFERIKEPLSNHEGNTDKPYFDSKGILTVGIGANINDWDKVRGNVHRRDVQESRNQWAIEKLLGL